MSTIPDYYMNFGGRLSMVFRRIFADFTKIFFLSHATISAHTQAPCFVCKNDVSLCAVDITNDLAHCRHADLTASKRIFDAHDRRGDGGLDAGALEGEVAIHHFAINEGEVFAVAEGLGADDPAVLEGEIFAVPGEIFTAKNGIFHSHVFRVPKSVLAVDDAVFEEAVFDVLQGIFGAQLEVFRAHAVVSHEKIFALGGAVFERYVVGEPAEFVRNDLAIFKPDVLAFTKSLDAMKLAVCHGDVLVIPEGGAAVFGERTIFQHEAVVVPEAVAQVEEAVLDAHVLTFLERALAVSRAVENAVLHAYILQTIQRAFFIKLLILNHHYKNSSLKRMD